VGLSRVPSGRGERRASDYSCRGVMTTHYQWISCVVVVPAA